MIDSGLLRREAERFKANYVEGVVECFCTSPGDAGTTVMGTGWSGLVFLTKILEGSSFGNRWRWLVTPDHFRYAPLYGEKHYGKQVHQ
jgi:hypothetical protein